MVDTVIKVSFLFCFVLLFFFQDITQFWEEIKICDWKVAKVATARVTLIKEPESCL